MAVAVAADEDRAACAAILAIATALEHPIADLGAGRPPGHAVNLTDGSAGTALVFAYLARASEHRPAFGDPERWATAALAHVEHAAVGAAGLALEPGLSAGISGVAWAMAHVARVLDVEVELPAAMDDALIAWVSDGSTLVEPDLISGWIGIGVYFLERLPDPRARRGLCAIVERLAASATETAAGMVWRTPPERVAEDRRARYPQGYVDLGLAHGHAGVIGFLASVYAAGIAAPRCRALLEASVAWLLARARAAGWDDGVPWADVPGVAPVPARLAWCYGEAGVAITVARAGAALGQPGWVQWAFERMRRAERWSAADAGVEDTSLCHGSAGLSQICVRLLDLAPDAGIAAQRARWRGHMLDDRGAGARPEVAGFSARIHDGHRRVWTAERGLLNGAAGVGLALLATLGAGTPAWDRALLLSA